MSALHRQDSRRAPMSPPQGPLQPGEDFDRWFLRGLLIQAENERDSLQSTRWHRKQDCAVEPSPALAASMIAWSRIRAEMDDRALNVALGRFSLAWGCCVICCECPEYHEDLIAELRQQVVHYRVAIERQTDRIRWAIKPLIADRTPGDRIIAAAECIGGPLPRRRILEICRHAAAASKRKRRVTYA